MEMVGQSAIGGSISERIYDCPKYENGVKEMKYILKTVSPYEGIKKYINVVSAAGNPDFEQLWLEHAIDPYWNEWAAGQFNEERTRKEMANPIVVIDKLEYAVDVLIASDIEALLQNAYEKIAQLLPPPEPDKVVCVYPNIALGESLHGVVGTCIGDSILIQVNPYISEWQSYIPWVLAHEHNHTVWGYNYYYLKGNRGHDLLTVIITEGEADSFAKEICPEVTPFWIRALTVEQEREQWAALKEYLYCEDSMELHHRFFFGDAKSTTPSCTGYTIGFNIVQRYLKARKDVSFSELADKDAKEILEVSGYDGGGAG